MASAPDNALADAPPPEKLPDLPLGDEAALPSTEDVKVLEGGDALAKPKSKAAAPPKRPLTTSRRPATATAPSLSSATSSKRTIASQGLSKPPTRPPVTARPVRTTPSGAATSSASTEHKSRPSISSVDDGKRAGTGSESENKKPSSAATSKRVSLNPANTSRSIEGRTTPSTRDRRSTLISTPSAEKKPSASKPVSSSPMKEVLRTTTNNARPSPSSTASRPARAPASSTRGVPGSSTSDPVRKRLSTIPASPAQPFGSPASGTDSSASRATPSKSMRPTLGTRKSTMSVAIEQRLREMELVNDMLQIAMAEEGAEDDEVKEDYAKKADEALAAMRVKLEEARRNEGKPPIESTVKDSGPGASTATANIETEETAQSSSIEPSTSFNAELAAAQSKIARLELEIEAMSSKTQEFSKEAERASREVQQATDAIRAEHRLKIDTITSMHASELDSVQTQLAQPQSRMQQFSIEAERASKEVQSATDAIRQEHAAKIDMLSTTHAGEVAELCAQLAASQSKIKDTSTEADRASKEVQQATEAVRMEHTSNIDAPSKKHTAQLEETAKDHTKELGLLRDELGDLQAKAQSLGLQLEHAFTELQQTKESLQKEHASKTDVLSAKHNAELEGMQLQLTQSQEELKRVTEQTVEDLESARQAAKENNAQTLAKTLEEQKEKHASALQTLHEQLASQEQAGTDSASKIQQFSAEIASLTEQLHEGNREHQVQLEKIRQEQDLISIEKEKVSAQLEEIKERHAASLKEKEEGLAQLEGTHKALDTVTTEKEELLVHLENIKAEHASTLAEKQEALALRDKDHLGKLEELRTTHVRELEDRQISQNKHLDQLLTVHSQQLELSETTSRERLQSIESDYTTSKAHQRDLENSISTLSESHKEALRTKDQELASVAQVIESLQDQIQEIQQSKAREVEAAIHEARQNHERIIAQSDEKAEIELKNLEKAFAIAQEVHENEMNKVRQQVEIDGNTREKVMKDLETSRYEALELVRALEKDKAADLENKLSLEKGLEDASSEIVALKKVLETLDQDSVAKDDEQRLALKKVKDELDNTAKMLKEKATEHTALSDNHSAQIAELCQGHAKELENAKAEVFRRGEDALKESKERHNYLQQVTQEAQESHRSQMEALKAGQHKAVEEIQNGYKVTVKELESRIAEQQQQILGNDATVAERIASFNEDHLEAVKDMQSQHQTAFADAEKAHEAAIAKLQEQITNSQSNSDKDVRALNTEDPLHMTGEAGNAASEAELNDLKAQLAQAKADTAATKVENANLRRQKMQVEALRRQYSADDKDLRAALANDREALNELAAAAEEVGQVMIDPAELDSLKNGLVELSDKHAAEVAKFRESMSIESERRDKERKQGAETRDRLAAELSTMTTQLPVKDSEIENLRSVIDLARKEMDDTNARLEQARAASSEQEARHREEATGLDNLRAEIEVLKSSAATKTKGHARNKSGHNQELDALQTIADKERARAEQLRSELDTALGASDKHATRLREVEAALKVTTAELTEMKTRRADGNDFTMGSPVSKHGLRTSRWSVDAKEFTPAAVREALANSGNQANGLPKRKDADLGAHIEGMWALADEYRAQMAGLQVQMRQIEDVNTDMLQDQQRMVRMLDRVTSPRRPHSSRQAAEESYTSQDEVS